MIIPVTNSYPAGSKGQVEEDRSAYAKISRCTTISIDKKHEKSAPRTRSFHILRREFARTNRHHAGLFRHLEDESPEKHNTQESFSTALRYRHDHDLHYSADPKDRSYTYIVDGKEHPLGIWVENDSPRFVKATWEKSVLVIEYILRAPSQDVIHDTERWSLSSDGKTLTKDFEGKAKLAYVFDKQ